jgi:hypothetical protein
MLSFCGNQSFKRRLKASRMPKQTKGKSQELRFRIGVEFIDYLEKIAGTNRFGNSVGDVARRILEDGIQNFYRESQEFAAEHRKLKRGPRKRSV